VDEESIFDMDNGHRLDGNIVDKECRGKRRFLKRKGREKIILSFLLSHSGFG
jgi:hypothetical protein